MQDFEDSTHVAPFGQGEEEQNGNRQSGASVDAGQRQTPELHVPPVNHKNKTVIKNSLIN